VRSDGCAAPEADPPDALDVVVDGVQRHALVHTPPAGDAVSTSLPVVISFHGVSGSAALQRATDGLVELADAEGAVVVHPEGLPVGLNDQVVGMTGWDADGSEVDEPGFVAALLDALGAAVCIDTSRVFATGFSAGGNIALVVACALPDRIAAVAPVGAAYQPGECDGAPPVPVMALHGRDDLVVPMEGRSTSTAGELVPVRDALEAQALRNGCDVRPSTREASPGVQEVSWVGCTAPTMLLELDDHGHAWPGHPLPVGRDALVALFAGDAGRPPDPLMVAIGAEPDAMADNVLRTSAAVDATEVLWQFFSRV
jgi:polyhydroxybutyrate depolymerase